jgi:hypothetical protein
MNEETYAAQKSYINQDGDDREPNPMIKLEQLLSDHQEAKWNYLSRTLIYRATQNLTCQTKTYHQPEVASAVDAKVFTLFR